MKRIFTILSTIIVSLFLVYLMHVNTYSFLYISYPKILIQYNENGASYQQVYDSISKLANEHNSLVLRDISEPTEDGNTSSEFECIGTGLIPKGLQEASIESIENAPISGSYLIVGGDLTLQELSQQMKELGYSTEMSIPVISQVQSLLSRIIGNPIYVLALFIIILTYMSFTMILSSKQMRSSGIRMISGMSIQDIIKLDLLKDIKTLVMSFVIGTIVGISLMVIKDMMIYQLLTLFFKGLSLYILILFIISLLLSVTYAFSLKQVNLMSVIKGKLPTKRLLSIMLVGQMLALMVVCYGISRMFTVVPHIQILNQASQEWKRNDDLVFIQTSTTSLADRDNQEVVMNQLSNYVKNVMREHKALLVQSSIAWQTIQHNYDDIEEEYTRQKNVMYVSANYFDIQNIKLEEQLKTKLNTLTKGQFGLILPEKLKEKETYYVDMFEDGLNGYTKDSFEENAQSLFDMQAIVGYVPNHQERFVYNTTTMSTSQYLYDPIIVVVSPDSFSNAQTSNMFWSNAIDNVFTNGFDATVQLLKDNQIYQFISYINPCDSIYEFMKESLDTEIISTIVESILCMITSILLFNAMNLLYFEQFRREIFIKRLSGMSFLQQHGRYIASQGITMLVGTVICVFLNQNIVASVLVLLVFMVDALVVLYRQMRKENALAVSVLKGK